jgi:hypothetical protein
MKKKTVLFLIALAIPLYIWDSHVLLSGYFGSKKHDFRQAAAMPAAQAFAFSVPAIHFQSKGRSPFVAYKEKPKPAGAPEGSGKKNAAPKPAAPAVPPPKITITGIMWHPTSPIAMVTLPDGSSTTVKAGQTVGSFKFKTIEKTRVLVIAEGGEFWIAK